MVSDQVWHIGFSIFRNVSINHGFRPVSKMRFSVTSQGTSKKTCIKNQEHMLFFHVAPCLWVLYFVVYVSNSAFGARRENMWVFGVVFGCLYLSCCSPCVLLANDINGNPDKVRPADYQLNWKCWLAGLLVSCLLMTFHGKPDTGRPADFQLNWKTLAGWSPGVLFANDI